jgi:prepilin-type N-terminal cleavage/methylation domain-containing protein
MRLSRRPPSAYPSDRARRLARTARLRRGFTLVELMTALVAGLIVSMAMVGLSKQAMNTFHEEARNAAAEAALRNGLERIRSDLSMAGFLSTGNIIADNQSLHLGGSIPVCNGLSSTTQAYTGALPGIKHLAGIRLYSGSAATGATITTSGGFAANLEGTNNLYPDKIDIGGNFTNGEDYVGHVITGAAASSLGDTPCNGTNQVFQLDMNTATGWRLAVSCGASGALCTATSGPFYSAFHPGLSTDTTQYMVRIADNSNPTLFQYGILCATNPVVFAAGTPNLAFVNIDSNLTPIGDAANTSGNCKLQNWDAGNGITRIAAVQVVEWDVMSLQALPGTFPSATVPGYGFMTTADPNNFVLTRTFQDALGNLGASTLEPIAEYVVDLKFAFSVDNTVAGTTNPTSVPGAYATAPLVHMPFEAATSPYTNQQWGGDTTAGVLGPLPAGPQRIRSTRVRLVTRTALPDRTSINPTPPGDVVPQPSTTPGSPYIYRYCLGNAGVGNPGNGVCANNGGVTWARARTAITEVALPNQSHFFY